MDASFRWDDEGGTEHIGLSVNFTNIDYAYGMWSLKTHFDKSGIKQATAEESLNLSSLLVNQFEFVEENADNIAPKELKKIIKHVYQVLKKLEILNPKDKTRYFVRTIRFLEDCKTKNSDEVVSKTANYYISKLEKKIINKK